MEQPDALPVSAPALFQMWERQAEASEEFADEWREYALLLTTFHAAWERAPRTAEVCAQTNIEQVLIGELEHLADAIHAIFPRGGIMEFASYLTTSINKRTSRTQGTGNEQSQETGI